MSETLVVGKVTAKDVLDAIRVSHPGAAIVPEVVITDREVADAWKARHHIWMAQYLDETPDVVADVPEDLEAVLRRPSTRRIDALMYEAQMWTAIEIKVSRADFRRETVEKRAAWQAVTSKFVYAAPAGVIPHDEIPDGCGLWEIDTEPDRRGRPKMRSGRRAARNKNPQPIPSQVLIALAYRLTRQETS